MDSEEGGQEGIAIKGDGESVSSRVGVSAMSTKDCARGETSQKPTCV